MRQTKKHYIAIAAIIKAKRDAGVTPPELAFAVQVFIELAAADNPRFDRDRFREACGL